jgi:hypothetical protein
MFQSVAATPAFITPSSRRLNRRPLGRRSTQVSSVGSYTFKYHTRSTLSRSLSGAGLLNCFAGHTHAPMTRPLPHHNHSVHARGEADTAYARHGGPGAPGKHHPPHRKHHAEITRPPSFTHYAHQGRDDHRAPSNRALWRPRGPRRCLAGLRVQYPVGTSCRVGHFSTDMRAHMHLLSLLMCRSGLKLAACYLLGTAYLRSLSLLSLLSRALTLSRPRTQTQQVGTHKAQRGTLPPPPPRYLGAHASRSDAVA